MHLAENRKKEAQIGLIIHVKEFQSSIEKEYGCPEVE